MVPWWCNCSLSTMLFWSWFVTDPRTVRRWWRKMWIRWTVRRWCAEKNQNNKVTILTGFGAWWCNRSPAALSHRHRRRDSSHCLGSCLLGFHLGFLGNFEKVGKLPRLDKRIKDGISWFLSFRSKKCKIGFSYLCPRLYLTELKHLNLWLRRQPWCITSCTSCTQVVFNWYQPRSLEWKRGSQWRSRRRQCCFLGPEKCTFYYFLANFCKFARIAFLSGSKINQLFNV